MAQAFDISGESRLVEQVGVFGGKPLIVQADSHEAYQFFTKGANRSERPIQQHNIIFAAQDIAAKGVRVAKRLGQLGECVLKQAAIPPYRHDLVFGFQWQSRARQWALEQRVQIVKRVR